MKEGTNKSIIFFHSQAGRREGGKGRGRGEGGGGREVKYERIRGRSAK